MSSSGRAWTRPAEDAPQAAPVPGDDRAAMPAGLGGDGFDALFQTHREAVFRFLWRLLRNAADAEDLLQETFLTAWRKRAQFEGRGSVDSA